jgi:MFS family permease
MSTQRQLTAFYAFIALRWLRLTGALWILYLLHVGWSLWQVGIAEAAFHIVSFLTAIPTGIYADRVGRRRSLELGLLVGTITPLLEFWLAPHGLFPGAIAIGCGALGWSFIGGADQALLHDLSRLQADGVRSFARLYGRMDAISLLAGAIAAPLGGYLAVTFGWAYPFIGQACLTAAACLPVLLLPRGDVQPQHPENAADQVRVTATPRLRTALGTLHGRPEILSLVLFGAVLGIVATSNHLYIQATLTAKGESVLLATVVIGLSSLLAAAASAAAHRLAHVRSGSSLRLGATAFSLLLAALGFARGILAPLAYAAAASIEGGADVLYVTELNRVVPEGLRATLASAPDFLFSLGMIVVFPFEGWAMGRFGFGAVYTGLCLLLLAAVLWLHPHAGRRAEARTASQDA